MNDPAVIVAGIASGVAWAGAVWDVRTRRVPNVITVPATLSAFACWCAIGFDEQGFSGAGAGLGYSVGGWLSAVVPFLFLMRVGLGGGDMKMMGVVGAWTASWQAVVAVMGYAILTSVVIAIIIMLRRRLVVRTAGYLLASLWMRKSHVSGGPSASGAHVPFAVGIAVGATLVLLEVARGMVPGGLFSLLGVSMADWF